MNWFNSNMPKLKLIKSYYLPYGYLPSLYHDEPKIDDVTLLLQKLNTAVKELNDKSRKLMDEICSAKVMTKREFLNALINSIKKFQIKEP